MKQIFLETFICISLVLVSAFSFAQSTRTEQALKDLRLLIHQDKRELLAVINSIDRDERESAREIYKEYETTWQLVDHFVDVISLYYLVEKQNKPSAKLILNNYKDYFLNYGNISVDAVLLSQSQTKLPVLNNYAEKLKIHIKQSQKIVNAINF